MRTLLDTHAWIWWVTADSRLSRKARTAISAAQREEALWLSMISIWELAKKIEKQQLVLDRDLAEWLDLATNMPGLHLSELNRRILTASCQLPPPFHGDPADQIIVATARDHAALLISKDDKIRKYPHVRCLW